MTELRATSVSMPLNGAQPVGFRGFLFTRQPTGTYKEAARRMSEESDTACFKAWLWPADGTIKTVCVTGSKADQDTATCEALNGFTDHKVLLKYDGDQRH